MSAADKVLGRELCRLRTRAKMTQEEWALAEPSLGWDGTIVAKIEAGTRSVKAVELLTLGSGELCVAMHSLSLPDIVTAQRDEFYLRKASYAERRAARALDVDVAVVVGAAQRLWGQTLQAERQRVLRHRVEAGRPGGRGAAGQITRMLVDEMRTLIAQLQSGSGEAA